MEQFINNENNNKNYSHWHEKLATMYWCVRKRSQKIAKRTRVHSRITPSPSGVGMWLCPLTTESE